MNIKEISQKVAKFVEDLLQEELNNEIVNDNISESYNSVLNDEQEAFENGIVDDDFIMDMNDSDINQQTMEFLRLRGKK